MNFFKIVLAAAIILISGWLVTTETFADNKFSANYDVVYQVNTDGTTNITQNINLKNLTANFYATEYTLSIGATHITNVKAVDSGGGNIPIDLQTDGDTTKIHLTFNQKVVGLGKVLSFKLTYDSNDIAIRNGFVWEVTIPKLASPESIDSYNLRLKTPKEIGNVSSISPNPVANDSDGDFNVLSFNKDQLTQSGVNASFGDHQVFNFNLKYHLKNDKFFPVFQTIALPPDTEIQTVSYTKLSPQPMEITVDTDGNYLAKYRLDGNQSLEVLLSGQVKIWNSPKNPARSNWASQDLSKFTQSDKYWETNFPEIVDKAKELKTPQAIYNYVTTTLKYNYDRAGGKLERLGAATAINQPAQAVCMEYTDLFITLARAAGIPAREVDGYAYTTNSKLKPTTFSQSTSDTKSDILHAWPEYWNSQDKRWVQIDPTWGSTTGGVDYFNKLDMNHFVFVIKGLSSIEPYPAGSYKTDPQHQAGDVDVTIAPTETDVTTDPRLSLDLGSSVTAGLPFSGSLNLENRGNSTIFNARASIISGSVNVRGQDLGPIPPLSRRTVSFGGRNGDVFSSATDEVRVNLTGIDAKGNNVNLSDSQQLHFRPLYLFLLPIFGGLILVVIAIYLTMRYWPTLRPKLADRFPWLLPER